MTTSALCHAYDVIEKHLRSLEAINQDVESPLLITMLLSKFPKQVLTQISEKKGDSDDWTVAMIRKSLKKYIENREFADLHCQQYDTEYQSSVRFTTEAFYTGSGVAKTLQPKCHFCKNSHWSDECEVFQTVSDRKTRVKGHCFVCLRGGHFAECNVNRPCVYCKKLGIHHRSLCPNHFPSGDGLRQQSSTTSENQTVVQSTQRTSEGAVLVPYTAVGDTTSCLAADELVLMQTASVKLQNLLCNRSTQARLLFDCGSQRTYITQQTAHKLDLVITKTEKLSVCTFGSKTTKHLVTGTSDILIQLKNGTLFKMKVNIVPRISGTISRAAIGAGKLKKVVNIFDLADSIPYEEESSTIDILLGNDYYLDLVMCMG